MEQLSHPLEVERFDLATLNDASAVIGYDVIQAAQVIHEDKKGALNLKREPC